MEESSILKSNINRFEKSARLVFNSKDFTSSTILYFKTLFSALDLIILEKIGKIPKDHSERFRVLESKFPELYKIMDKYFPIYRDTYTSNISKNICEEVKLNVEKIIKEQKFQRGN